MKIMTYIPSREKYLRDVLHELFSHRQIVLLKQKGKIVCNGEELTADRKVAAGEEVFFYFPDPPSACYAPMEMDLIPVYEDGDYLIVDKGVGIACIPAGKEGVSIFNGLKRLYPGKRFHVLTRLDRDTAGLVLLAAHPLAAQRLDVRSVEKGYEALAEGVIGEELTVDAPIARVPGEIRRTVSPEGKRAVTVIKPLYIAGGNTVAECRLLTGRTHQIRVHLSHIGHAVVGDTLYGHGTGGYNGGQNLLCRTLSFVQPLTGKRIEVSSGRKFPFDSD